MAFHYKSKQRRMDCREPVAGEARVSILTAEGVLLNRRIGTLQKDGSCLVRWEKDYVAATKTAQGFEYRIPAVVQAEGSEP